MAANCDLKQVEGGKVELFLKLNFEDKMQRELCSELKEGSLHEENCTCIVFCVCVCCNVM